MTPELLSRRVDEWNKTGRFWSVEEMSGLIEELKGRVREHWIPSSGCTCWLCFGDPPRNKVDQPDPVKTEMSGFPTQEVPPSEPWNDRLKALDDAAEMLWAVLANVSGGDWSKQSKEWQDVAARWADNYFVVRGRVMPRTLPPYIRT